MIRVHASQISSGAGAVLDRVVTQAEGWFDLTNVRIEANLRDLRSPYLCNGDRRVAIPFNELTRAMGYVPGMMAPDNSNIVGVILLTHDAQAQIFWSRGICLLQSVEARHLEVLRVIQRSLSAPGERRELGVSYSDTVLELSAYYGCHGEHTRSCPQDGDRSRALIEPTGIVKRDLLGKLRRLGLSSPD